jgi:signal transduction histidine kinase
MSGRGLYFATSLTSLALAALLILAILLVRSRRAARIRTETMAAICHDLLTPLTRLRLRSERIDIDLREGVLHEVDRMDRMLREALDYFMHDARPSTERIDLVSVLRTICSEFSDVGYAITYDGPARLTLRCKATAITRAITNLVDNATKYGSEVHVCLTVRKDAVNVEISDDGPGIRSSRCRKGSEPFFKEDGTPDAREHGFGLGLAIAREVARSHRGRIVLENRATKGLRVRLSLPRSLVIRE